jgi:D-erythrulose 1-phosphate 3-epimerase
MFPKIYLAVDNCFASKRWTEPHEWMQVIRDAGANFVEASADTECDPLYSPPEVLNGWIDAVHTASQRFSMRVSTLYSGHGTYATLGLAHPDARVRDHIQHRWLEPMINQAAALKAGLGFFCHAFSQSTLADRHRYDLASNDLIVRLGELSDYAAGRGVSTLSVEQMYAPHQIPWTIKGTTALLADVYAQGRTPLYITVDTGHQIGQKRFRCPTHDEVERHLKSGDEIGPEAQIWLGLQTLLPIEYEKLTVDQVMGYVEEHGHLFSDAEDSDLYAWIEQLGAYSPVIHLQQTDGTVSAHRPFTPWNNRTGIVSPREVLAALYRSYLKSEDQRLPPRCQEVFLTLEVFSGTAERSADILANIAQSVAYWRQFLPEDGVVLDQLLDT